MSFCSLSQATTQHINKTNPLYRSDSLLVNDLHPKIKLSLQSVLVFLSRNVGGWWVLQDAEGHQTEPGS